MSLGNPGSGGTFPDSLSEPLTPDPSPRSAGARGTLLAHPHCSQATYLVPPALGCGGERSAGRFVPGPAAAAAAGQLPAQAVVDEAVGECDEEVARHGGLGLLDVEAVAQQAVEDSLADVGVIVGLGGHVQRPGAEELAAAAAGLVLCVGDLQPGEAVVGGGTEPSVAGGARTSTWG